MDAGTDMYMKERTAEWSIDACERIVKEIKDNNQQLLEGTLRNKTTAQKLLTRMI